MAIARRVFASAACILGLAAAQGATPELADSVDSFADLTLDPGFGASGMVTAISAAGGRIDQARFVAIDGAGRIVVAGIQIESENLLPGTETGSPGIARFLADGSLDPSFGDGGVVVPPLTGYLLGLTLGDAGRIVICGRLQGTLLEMGPTVFG